MPQRLSVIIVSYHSIDDLRRCLPTVLGQGHPDLEVIVVDNSPGDGTASWLATTYPAIKVVTNGVNDGYAGGNNLGIAHATGSHVLILNPDTQLHPGSLDALQHAVELHPNALITATLVTPDGAVNACGTEMHYTGITTCRGLGSDPASVAELQPVPLLSGAAFITTKAVLEELDGFDDDYFMYFEDTDLSLRAKVLGYTIFCAGNAVVTHDYALGMTASKYYYLERNRLSTILKVYQADTLWRIAPALLLTELATVAFALLNGPAYLRARARSYAWLWRHRDGVRAKRRSLQAARLHGDERFLHDALVRLPLAQLIESKGLARLLVALTLPLYQIAFPHRMDAAS